MAENNLVPVTPPWAEAEIRREAPNFADDRSDSLPTHWLVSANEPGHVYTVGAAFSFVDEPPIEPAQMAPTKGSRASDETRLVPQSEIHAGRSGSTLVEPKPAAGSHLAGDWQRHLIDTIEALEHEIDELPADDEAMLRESQLRLLYLIANDRTSAVRPITCGSDAEREFWRQQMHGLSIYLTRNDIPLDDRRAKLALHHLREATEQLALLSGLEVRNLALCTRVDSYGRYTEFKTYQFRPDQEVLLYVEIENLDAQLNEEKGFYETSLRGSYQVYDPGGKRVAERTFPLEKEICRNRRRDFFIPFRMYIPKVAPGAYKLELTIEDLQGEKFGQAPLLDFTVVD